MTTRPRFDSRALALAGLTRDQVRMLESLFKDLDTLAAIQVVLGTANALFPAGRVLTDTATVDIDTATAGQIRASVIDGSITTTKLGGDITTAGKALLDDANAAAQLVTLGAMPATTTLDAIPTPVASVEFDQQQALQFRIENRTSDPGSPAVGEIWLRTDL